MIKFTKSLSTLTALSCLCACGGSNGGGTNTVTYETLGAASNATSDLGGVARQSNSATGVLTLVDTTGSLAHTSGALTINEGAFTFMDADGLTANGVGRDGTAAYQTNTDLLTGTYAFATVYNLSSVQNGVATDSLGLIGVITDPNDLGTGSATYTGSAAAILVTDMDGFDLRDGTSTLVVDLQAGTVDATLRNFSVTNQSEGAMASVGFDTIALENMAVSDNRFEGDTIRLLSNTTDIAAVGANADASARGAFFGYDPSLNSADEVGGLFLMEGDNGLLTGAFLAD